MVTARHTSTILAHGIRHGRRATRRTRGQSLFEFAIVMPLVAYLFCCIVDVARVNLMWHRALTATEYAIEMATDNPPIGNNYGFDNGNQNTTNMISILCNALNDMKVPIKSVSDCEVNNVTFSTAAADNFGADGRKFTITVTFTVTPILPIAFRGPDGRQYNLFSSYTVTRQRTLRVNQTTFNTGAPT